MVLVFLFTMIKTLNIGHEGSYFYYEHIEPNGDPDHVTDHVTCLVPYPGSFDGFLDILSADLRGFPFLSRDEYVVTMYGDLRLALGPGRIKRLDKIIIEHNKRVKGERE
tara:strand:+ start:3344 stop:3670 length:327 start_codon:yes stop_codon:yes gene_type:complete